MMTKAWATARSRIRRLTGTGARDLRSQLAERRSPIAAAPFHRMVLIPFVLLLLAFAAYALWLLFSFALSDVSTLNLAERTYVGLHNVAEVLQDRRTIRSILNSAIWIGGSVVGAVLLGVGTGVILSGDRRTSLVVRGLILLPWVIPGVVTATIWKWIFNSQTGVLADVMLRLGIVDQPIPFLGMPETALSVEILVNVWRLVPVLALIIAAGVNSIDPALYEAAEVDGATSSQRLRFITLPLIRPHLATTALLAAIWSANSIVFVNVMTGGGPAGATTILPLRIYQLAFESFDMGGAAVVSILNLLLLAAVGAFYVKKMGGREVDA